MSSATAAETFDVAVVGAGAAGLIAAITAATQPTKPSVVLYDSRVKIGAKILISGGTRCNVTNRSVSVSDYHGGSRHFIRHVLEAYTPEQTIEFFKELGVELVLEPTGKYFPTTHSGRTVLEALMRGLDRSGAVLRSGVKITGAERVSGGFRLSGRSAEEAVEARCLRLVLATGGLSYPETGSDGTGFQIARSFGHTLVEMSPALTPLVSDDAIWNALSGVTLESTLSFYSGGSKKAESRGSFLFTHTGFSGPAALDVSRHFARARAEASPKIMADFIPDHTEPEAVSLLLKAKDKRSRVKNAFAQNFGLPSSFVEGFMKKSSVADDAHLAQMSDADLRRCVHRLKHCPLAVTGVVGYKKAEVTAGGVNLSEVRVSDLASKIVPGLFFAGEILDVDGRIGGFNFQWAWSSGALAGCGAGKGF